MDPRLHALLREIARGSIPGDLPADLDGVEVLAELVAYLKAIQEATLGLAEGDLGPTLQGVRGPVAGSLKALKASLRHLTWQTARIADGDFTQRVDFMGDFSAAFNAMVDHLDRARAALRESEERFRLIAENVSDVIWTLDPATRRFTYVSPSIALLRGLTPAEAAQETLDAVMTEASFERLLEVLRRAGDEGARGETIEIEQICADGRTIPVEVVLSAVRDAQGRLKELVGVSRDVTERKKRELQLVHESTHDALTGLHNRAFLDAEFLRISALGPFPVSVVFADLDGLKRVNDTLGHAAGDRLIIGAATVLSLALRRSDVVVRAGGDEFVALLVGTDEAAAAATLERIRARCARFETGLPELTVSLSLGASTAQCGEDLPAALKAADAAMYVDKAARRLGRS